MSKPVFDPHMWTLFSAFENAYDVPVYQRPYSWGIEEVKVLLNDIQEYISFKTNESCYMGNIIVFDKQDKIDGNIDKYDIIDGQQRFATFALILLSIYSLSLNKGISKDVRELQDIQKMLWKLINREPRREHPAVKLNSIEKDCFQALFDACFDNPKQLEDFAEKYKCHSYIEKNLINNFLFIYRNIETYNSGSTTKLLEYANYIINNIQFVVIQANCNESQVFSIFESINSKGKKLETIDHIKTYIFSKIDESSYKKYLGLWGQLIIETNDELYDYLYTYIKSYISFYRQNITIENFKLLSSKKIIEYFNATSENEALKMLLDDMADKVKYYNMLSSGESTKKIINNNKFRFYYKVFINLDYKHPKALFMRALYECDKKILKKTEMVEIVSEVIIFMMKFLSICNRDSKDAITMFSEIMNDIYKENKITKSNIMNILAEGYIKQSLTTDLVKKDLCVMDAYNKKVTRELLALFESTYIAADDKVNISYDQAYLISDSFSKSFSLDHLLVQTPDPKDKKYKYYKDDNKLLLKRGHDFPKGTIFNEMNYDIFTQSILNRIGNLRIYYKDKNSARSNLAIQLKEYDEFYKFRDISERSEEVCDILLNKCMPLLQIKNAK